jgi:glycine hydroxymethyltransferase
VVDALATWLKVNELVDNHDEYFQKSINLNSGEWTLSTMARKVWSSHLYGRAAAGSPFKPRNSTGTMHIDEIDSIVIKLLKELFKVKFSEYRCPTVTVANNLAVRLISETRDKTLVMNSPIGHIDWATEKGTCGHRNLNLVKMPVNEHFNIDLDVFTELVQKNKPKVVIVGSALLLFPYPIKAMKEILNDEKIKLMIDGAYALGPILSEIYPDPLHEGANILTGSTGKTLCGPKAGLIMFNDPTINDRLQDVVSGYVSGVNHARIATLAITLAEMSKFGKVFFKQTNKNACALGKALDIAGFKIVGKQKGYTKTNMIAVDVSKINNGRIIAKKLENANILCTVARLNEPYQEIDGLRLGLSAISRYGLKEKEMKQIAEFIRRIIIDEENPAQVKEEIESFIEPFNKVQYTFER